MRRSGSARSREFRTLAFPEGLTPPDVRITRLTGHVASGPLNQPRYHHALSPARRSLRIARCALARSPYIASPRRHTARARTVYTRSNRTHTPHTPWTLVTGAGRILQRSDYPPAHLRRPPCLAAHRAPRARTHSTHIHSTHPCTPLCVGIHAPPPLPILMHSTQGRDLSGPHGVRLHACGAVRGGTSGDHRARAAHARVPRGPDSGPSHSTRYKHTRIHTYIGMFALEKGR